LSSLTTLLWNIVFPAIYNPVPSGNSISNEWLSAICAVHHFQQVEISQMMAIKNHVIAAFDFGDT
jgi:hypothetical protein